MHYLLAFLLALLSLLFVSYPLLKTRQREIPSDSRADTDSPPAQNIEETLDDIDRLQMEYELGVIEPLDYQRQMDELRRAAAETLRAYEQESPPSTEGVPQDLDALLEERIRLHRRTLRNGNGKSS